MPSALPTPLNGLNTNNLPVNVNHLDTYIREAVDVQLDDIFETFATATALRAYAAYVDGYRYFVSAVTGGAAQGVWYYDSTSEGIDDGSTVVKPDNIASGPGRYVRELPYFGIG